jgi:hypothetical protein
MRRITSAGWGLCLVALALPAAAGQPRRVSLTGNVSGPHAEGVVRARLKFSDDQTGAIVARATTDALGSYSVTLPRGKYDVEVVPASEAYVPTTIQDQVVAGPQILDLALPRMDDALYEFEVVDASGTPLVPRWLDGQVCDSFFAGFDPIDGLGVVRPALNTSGNGIWTLAAVPGEYTVSVGAQICADTSAAGGFDFLYGQLLSTRTVPAAGPEQLNIGGHRVTGRVVNESGVALAGQFLTAQSTLTDSHATWNANDYATTDANGEFEITVGDSGFFQLADSELTWLVELPFAAPPSEPVELVLPNSVDQTVRVTGPGGVPIFSGSCAFAFVDLTRTDGATRVSTQVDTDGEAHLRLPAGTYTGSLSFYGCGYSSAPLPQSFTGTRLASESLPSGSTEEWQLPTHFVTGTVKDENGEPYNDIFVIAEMTSVSDGWEASLRDEHYTQFNGEFQLSLMNGTGTLNVAGKLVPFDTSDPSTLDVVVPRKVPFQLEAYGGPMPGVCNWVPGTVTLTPTEANPDLTTEYGFASGPIVGSAQPGEYEARAEFYAQCYEAYPTQDWVFESREPVNLPSDALPSLDVTPIELEVSLQEADGRPLSASLSLTSRGSNEHWNITARSHVEGLLDQPVTLLTIPGDTEVFLFTNDWRQEHILLGEIGSQSIVITAQAVAEASAAVTLAAGESVTTDYEADGTYFGDLVETTLTVSSAGTARIIEGAIDIAAPNNFAFIAQQVSVLAPGGTARNPLQLDFEVDASSFEGTAPNDVQVFNEGDRVAACRGRNGRATPDPCIAERGVTEAGTLELRVLTSHTGRWNFGVRTTP